jgi:hypothetical protein
LGTSEGTVEISLLKLEYKDEIGGIYIMRYGIFIVAGK